VPGYAAAGEQIEARGALQPLPEPVEQRLAHPIRRRPHVGARRHANAPAAPVAADDAHAAGRDALARIHRAMLAATSWTARLKNGLARTRAALGGGLGALFRGASIDEPLYEELETALLTADCGVAATRALLDGLRARARRERIADPQALKAALQEELRLLLAPLEKPFDASRAKPLAVMMAGVNGSGKTTSIGKLAKWLQGRGLSVLLAAGDTFRAAAREQLVAWGERNGVGVIAQASGDAAAVVFDAAAAARARGIDVLIADTAGRLPTQLHLMEEIKKVKRVLAKALPGAPHEVLLVLDANTGQNALAQVKAFDEALGLTGLVLTKLDGTARGGVVCAIARERPLPLYFVGVGEGIDDLRPFSAAEFAEALVD
jgi:fused signal recognition particle receptor